MKVYQAIKFVSGGFILGATCLFVQAGHAGQGQIREVTNIRGFTQIVAPSWGGPFDATPTPEYGSFVTNESPQRLSETILRPYEETVASMYYAGLIVSPRTKIKNACNFMKNYYKSHNLPNLIAGKRIKLYVGVQAFQFACQGNSCGPARVHAHVGLFATPVRDTPALVGQCPIESPGLPTL